MHKALNGINYQANIQHNKLMKLDITMLMYGIYNVETLEKLINTVHEIHNATSSHKKLFAGEHNHSLFRILYMDALGVQQYATNSLLFLRIIQDKYISLYRELITQLHAYVSAIRLLAKGYLPNTLITPKKLQESCSKLEFSVTEHLVEVVDKLLTTAVVFFRSERILKLPHISACISVSFQT